MKISGQTVCRFSIKFRFKYNYWLESFKQRDWECFFYMEKRVEKLMMVILIREELLRNCLSFIFIYRIKKNKQFDSLK